MQYLQDNYDGISNYVSRLLSQDEFDRLRNRLVK